MSLIETKTGRKFFKKASSMMLVPYVYDMSLDDYVLGSDVYDISAVIGDSIMVEQKDGEVEEKFNEFVRSPLVRNVTAGSYDFTAQCLDLQDKVLRALFGVYTASGANGVAEGVSAFPDDYLLQYAMIRIQFKGSELPDIVFPKVQMNSKMLLQQMKTRGSQGNISGTALSREVAVIDKDAQDLSVLQFSPIAGQPTYAPFTPILFVPRDYTPMVLHHIDDGDDDTHIFSTVDFTTGTVSHNRSVNISNGSYEIVS
jgi:hypothetical protein